MQTDRTTKILLFLIAVALWGLLLRHIVDPMPLEAGAAVSSPMPVNIVAVGYQPVKRLRSARNPGQASQAYVAVPVEVETK
jgi:hypothetical protein